MERPRSNFRRISGMVGWITPFVLLGCALLYHYWASHRHGSPAVTGERSEVRSPVALRQRASDGSSSASNGEGTGAATDMLGGASGVDDIRRDVETELTKSEGWELAEFEAQLRENLKSGWKPPWRGLEIKAPEEEIRRMPTRDLAVALFSTGIHSREMGLYTNPNIVIKRLEVCYKGYAELFGRADLWRAMVEMIKRSASRLDAHGKDQENLAILMGLKTLTDLYGYPALRRQIVGHEKEFIAAHIEAISSIGGFYRSIPEREPSTGAAFIVLANVPMALADTALVMGERVAPAQAAEARGSLSRFRRDVRYTRDDVVRYTDQALVELRKLIQ